MDCLMWSRVSTTSAQRTSELSPRVSSPQVRELEASLLIVSILYALITGAT